MLTSVRFAVFYIGTLAFFGFLGIIIPQIPEAMRGNNTAIQAWLQTKEDTFGPFTDTMYRLGLFSVFQSRWFLFALGFRAPRAPPISRQAHAGVREHRRDQRLDARKEDLAARERIGIQHQDRLPDARRAALLDEEAVGIHG